MELREKKDKTAKWELLAPRLSWAGMSRAFSTSGHARDAPKAFSPRIQPCRGSACAPEQKDEMGVISSSKVWRQISGHNPGFY